MEQESVLVVRAKVVEDRPFGHGGTETRKGTKHFRPGAKVYVIDGYRGTCETVTVIGHHRSSGRFAVLDMPVKHLEGFRLDRNYSPKVISLIEEHYAGYIAYTEEIAQKLFEVLPLWKAEA